MEGVPALSSGFTRLCKGLAAVLVIGYSISQVFPSAVDYLALVPGKTVPFAWNLVTAGYLEQSIFGLIVNIAGLLFSGKLLQPIWGAKEFLKFIAVVNFFASFSTFILAVLMFYITGRENFLYMPLSGFHGVLSGFLVGMKQVMPDQEVMAIGAYVIRAKWLPSLLVLLSVIVSFLSTESMPYLPFVIFGTYGSWLYLRYFQRNPDTHLKGYPTEDFAFSTFFPSFMRPILDPFATMCQKIFCQNAPVPSEVGDSYAAGGVYIPGSDPLEASRRRERGARALDERLGTANSGEAVGERLPQDASNNV
ncbi:rhomboid-like protein 19 [Cryptomeria japonica]|uniref:rhomboid-like protein 19 n=1 Tax=Cryptomeria japonica TaxID=3369 RepID=UPI0027DA344A|nr:rhomboid-like protein 19 [Cryptomeria japonica]